MVFILGGWKLFQYVTRTPVDAFFKDKESFGILIICSDKSGEDSGKITFFSVATIYPRTQRIGLISFLPDTRLKEDEPGISEKATFTNTKDLANEISNLLNVPIPYYVKTTVDNLSQMIDLIEGVPMFMWSNSIIEGESLPVGEFNLSGPMVRRFLEPPVKNETKPAMDLFRYYTLLFNIWNNRESKWATLQNEKIFSIFSDYIDTNLSDTELYALGKKFGLTEGWNLTSIEIPVKRLGNNFLLDYESTALFLKNFKKDLTEHENPFLARMPRMEVKKGTEVSNLAK
jgi:anionic cell wall polymer biosynthesis LytR-Cps2A-Psr (LCP) family protein